MAREPSIHASWTAGTVGVLPSPGRLLLPRDTNWGRTRRTNSFSPPPETSDSGAVRRGAGRATAERTGRRMPCPVSPAVNNAPHRYPHLPAGCPGGVDGWASSTDPKSQGESA